MKFLNGPLAASRQAVLRSIRFLRISFLELRAENRMTVLGVLWIPATSVLFAFVLAVLFRPIAGSTPAHGFLYVLVGYSLWQFIASTFNSSIDLMRLQFNNAVHNGLSLSGLYLKALSDRAVELALNLAVCSLAMLVIDPGALVRSAALLFLAVGMVLIASLAASYLVSLASLLFPDLGRLIKTSTRFLFFVSPVFWSIEATGQPIRLAIYSFNPVSYYLETMRQAFGIEAYAPQSWVVSVAITLSLAGAGWLAFSRTRTIVTNIK